MYWYCNKCLNHSQITSITIQTLEMIKITNSETFKVYLLYMRHLGLFSKIWSYFMLYTI